MFSGRFLAFFGIRYLTVSVFCEWIWESKVSIGNTYKDCKKLQYFVSGISIAAVCFQELGNGECVTHAQTALKLWSELTPVKIYFIYSLNGEWKNILTLHVALDNNANMPGFTSNIKVMLERTRKDNFFLNQKVIIRYYVKSRSTQVPLLSLSVINFWWSCFSQPVIQSSVWPWVYLPGLLLTPTCRLTSQPGLGLSSSPDKCLMSCSGATPDCPLNLPCSPAGCRRMGSGWGPTLPAPRESPPLLAPKEPLSHMAPWNTSWKVRLQEHEIGHIQHLY